MHQAIREMNTDFAGVEDIFDAALEQRNIARDTLTRFDAELQQIPALPQKLDNSLAIEYASLALAATVAGTSVDEIQDLKDQRNNLKVSLEEKSATLHNAACDFITEHAKLIPTIRAVSNAAHDTINAEMKTVEDEIIAITGETETFSKIDSATRMRAGKDPELARAFAISDSEFAETMYLEQKAKYAASEIVSYRQLLLAAVRK